MKKFPSLLALALAVMMLMLPMGALAETTEAAAPAATVIQIANPSFSYAGETRSMSGLALQLALCENADASLAQIIADVLVNNQNAGSAMLQIDSALNLVGLVGGMSNAYTMNLEDAMTAAAGDMSAYTAQAEQLVTMLETWTLPETISTIITNHFNTYTVTDMGTSANASGVELQYMSISGDITNLIIDVLSAIDTDALVLSVAEMMNGYPVDSLGLVEGFGIGGGNGMRMDATVGTDAAGAVIDVDADITVYSDGVDAGIIRVACDLDSSNVSQAVCGLDLSLVDIASGETIGYASFDLTGLDNGYNAAGTIDMGGEVITLNSALALTDAQDSFNLNVNVASEYSDYPTALNVTFTNVKNGTSGNLTAKFDMTDYGDTTGLTIAGAYNLTDTGLTANGNLTLTDPYSGSMVFTLSNLSIDAVNGGFDATVSYDDDYTEPMTFSLALTPSTPASGAIYSGVISFSGNDGYETVGISADVNVFTAAVDTATFYIDPATAINLMTMDELQMQTAETELNTILENLGNTIMNAYPDFFN